MDRLKRTYSLRLDQNLYKADIHIHMVMYGWRIRIGRCFDDEPHPLTYDYNICAGNKAEDVEKLYNLFVGILEENKGFFMNHGYFPIKELDMFITKPVMNDKFYPDFIRKWGHITPAEYTHISEVELLRWRMEEMGDLAGLVHSNIDERIKHISNDENNDKK